MFTSRSEYRLTIRSDNADMRLTEKGRAAGVVSDARWSHFMTTRNEIARVTEFMQSRALSPQAWQSHGFSVQSNGVMRSVYDMVRHKGVTLDALKQAIPELAEMDPQIVDRVAIDAIYNLHLRRQEADLRYFHEDESLALDPHIDYHSVEGLSLEVKERLARVRPTSIGAARRMEGMTPTSMISLLKYAKKTFGSIEDSLSASVA